MTDAAETTASAYVGEAHECLTHYRHMEQLRLQYMNFLFTVDVASAGFVVTILKDGKLTTATLFALLPFVGLVYLVNRYLTRAISGAGRVLATYEDIISDLRRAAYSGDGRLLDILDVRQRLPEVSRESTRPTRNALQAMLPILDGVFLIGLSALTAGLASRPEAAVWQIAIAAAATTAVAADIAISLYPSAKAWVVRRLASA
ncbi:hypothetical protein [Sphingosinicella sp. BN140058]|uniref:hypothetical protein n=1 Tax=Sphingosinicella sp. BN140058 TaxID=1892855 RepID=UPI001013202B|nr:hypothetical protein [Sphingosinicella sp. BN140058]QAY78674.1 hypothetical protein ETR14_20625 [Sphingosinicella sp. BN140058]